MNTQTTVHAPDKVNLAQRHWLWQVTALALFLGLLLGAALRAQRNFRQQNIYVSRYGVPASAYREQVTRTQQLQAEIQQINKDKSRLEKALAEDDSGAKAARELNRELQDAKAFAGLTPLSGPGVVVTLNDADPAKRKALSALGATAPEDYIIHDLDIYQVVNELRVAGAEAVAINDERLTATSPIRCEGPTVRVNYTQVGVPLHIKAIGDPKALYSGLSMAGGVLDPATSRLGTLGMATMVQVPHLTVPAFAGPTTFKRARTGQ